MMRQRQQAMMQRMQKKQKEAVESLSLEGESYDDGSCEDAEALQCATCREAASASNPLAMLAAVGDFQGRSSHLGGQPGFRRYTSCRHVIHITCGQQHVVDAHNQAAQRLRRVSLFDVDRGEFGCPMCRSVANALVLYVPNEEFLESPSSWDEAATARVVRREHAIDVPKLCELSGLGKEVDPLEGSLTLLRAAAAELATSAQLAPQALADEGPPLPLFVMLFRNAALLRHSAAHTQAINQEENWQKQVLERIACPRQPWLADLRCALADLLLDSLKEGLTAKFFSELVMFLFKVRASQAKGAAGHSQEDFALEHSMEFLIFAAWLGTALWQFSPQERNRLAYLETESSSLTSLMSLLRLPEMVEPVLERPALQALFQGELADASIESFIQLPESFLDILKDIRKRPCSACQQQPEEPALCLLCGAVVCVGNEACRSEYEGQCTLHARACTAGQSLFLLPFLAQILAVSAPDCCLWDCPYVDKNGEPNPNHRRPCIMHFRLDHRRWASLRETFVKSAVRREIFLYNEKTGQYIPDAL